MSFQMKQQHCCGLHQRHLPVNCHRQNLQPLRGAKNLAARLVFCRPNRLPPGNATSSRASERLRGRSVLSHRCGASNKGNQSHQQVPDEDEEQGGLMEPGDLTVNDPVWNPDMDDVSLDDDFYELMGRGAPQSSGMDDDDEGNGSSSISSGLLDVDPESRILGVEDMEAMLQDPAFQGLFSGEQAAPYEPTEQDEVDEAMPKVVLLAGLRAEELPMVRVLMDRLGWQEVRAVPVTSAMLQRPVAFALAEAEPEWEKPRTGEWLGGGWGAERILLFSGLPTGSQAQLVEIMEQSGMPPVSVARVMSPEDVVAAGSLVLGELLATAVQQQRSARRAAARPLWEDAPERIGKLGDLEETLQRARAAEEKAAAAEEEENAEEEEEEEEPSDDDAGNDNQGPTASGGIEGEGEQPEAPGTAENIIDELAAGLLRPVGQEEEEQQQQQQQEGAFAAFEYSHPGIMSYEDLHYSGGRQKKSSVAPRRGAVDAPADDEQQDELSAITEGPVPGSSGLSPRGDSPASVSDRRDSRPSDKGSDLSGALARAKEAGMSANALKEMLEFVAEQRGSGGDGGGSSGAGGDEKDEGHQIIPVTQEVEALLNYGQEQKKAPSSQDQQLRPSGSAVPISGGSGDKRAPQQPGAPPELKAVLKRAVDAGVPATELKALMAKMMASAEEKGASSPR